MENPGVHLHARVHDYKDANDLYLVFDLRLDLIHHVHDHESFHECDLVRFSDYALDHARQYAISLVNSIFHKFHGSIDFCFVILHRSYR